MSGTPASTSGTSTQDAGSTSRLSLIATAKREAAKRILYARFFRGPVLASDKPLEAQTSAVVLLETVPPDEGQTPKETKRKRDNLVLDEDDRRKRRRSKEKKSKSAGVKEEESREKTKGRKKEETPEKRHSTEDDVRVPSARTSREERQERKERKMRRREEREASKLDKTDPVTDGLQKLKRKEEKKRRKQDGTEHVVANDAENNVFVAETRDEEGNKKRRKTREASATEGAPELKDAANVPKKKKRKRRDSSP